MELNIEVHPVADLFPMLPADELQGLAEDIKTRGQLQPIVLDSEGRILDGRNRFAACQIAEVEPQFVTYEGDDPDGYALAVNIARRHMTKGQQAIVVAKALLVSSQSHEKAAASVKVSRQRVTQANVILTHAPDLADGVLAATVRFDAAYEVAKQRKQEQFERTQDGESLREEAPDLADAVAEESISLEAAKEQLRQRREDAARAGRIAPIDVLVAESGARTFAERVEASEITWAEAEELAAQWKREFDEAVERNVRRINEVAGGGWQALARMFREPDAAFNARVAEKLPDSATKFIQEIKSDVIELATTWKGKK